MQRPAPVVLIVDDDDAVRQVLVELVASRGYSVAEACDGDDAWRQLRKRRLDVVVSDLQMPRCDGRELCRRIRSEPTLRDIRIVVISGRPDLLDTRELNCDSVLVKPISVPMLMREIEQVHDSGPHALPEAHVHQERDEMDSVGIAIARSANGSRA
jgi:two-component system phosphate regulon response regulator PhoB